MGNHHISSDDSLNPALADEVASLRGTMLDAAETAPLSDRYLTRPHPDRAAMVLTDRVTGRTTTVGLYAYSEVREALTDLFGEEPKLTADLFSVLVRGARAHHQRLEDGECALAYEGEELDLAAALAVVAYVPDVDCYGNPT